MVLLGNTIKSVKHGACTQTKTTTRWKNYKIDHGGDVSGVSEGNVGGYSVHPK